jgi:predicted CXXCH cytochrome family protein
MKKAFLLVIGLCFIASPVLAFHDGGVAHCNGCHTMHNSQDGALVDPDSPNGNPYLLVDGSPSDVCIACHDHLDQPLGSDPMAPPALKGAGNFVFLLEDNLNDGHGGATSPIPGDAAGHNLVAPGHGLAADATLTFAPGGGFPAAVMSCTSCHDPHGTTDFRFLYGAGRQVQGSAYTFTNPAPDAEGLSLFGAPESQTNHTAYQGGMSAWCGNCHGNFHDNNTQLVHPAGQTLGGTVAQTYNLYNGTIDQLGGAQATAYLAEVPFEDAANTTSSTAGPTAASQVSCITCHRAHATSAPDAGRWDFSVTFLHEDGVESGSYPIPPPALANYQDLNQRSLCNKCHNKDAFDENPF